MISLKSTKNRHLLLKTPEIRAVARVEAALLKGARKYFEYNNFHEVIVPSITKATGSCENIDTLFETSFFGRTGYLRQTGQLYLESLIPTLGNVYCIGPSFRAEPDVDNRHLTEFTLVEMEFPGDFDMLLGHIENIIHSMIRNVLSKCKKDLEFLGVDLKRLEEVRPPFKKVTYTEAVEMLSEDGVAWGDDLKSHHEKKLVEHFGGKPLFLTHFPIEIKFFNMKRNPENPKIVNSADLLLPFSGEAVGAAEREYEYEKVLERLKNSYMLKQLENRGGSIEDFKWYLDFLKEHGNVPHSGCGIGLNRVTQFVLGIDDIRASTVFPQNRESLL